MGKKSQSTTTTVRYGDTTTSNPYASAHTNNSGTTASLNSGTALDTIFNFVNNNMSNLLNDYLNPNLNSVTNQAKLNSFTKALNTEASKSFENNIINPLSRRNMLRSSQATDMYNNLARNTTNSLSDYINDLLATSQENSASILNNLLAAYMLGYDVLSDMQNQSLRTSSGNATVNSNTTSRSSFSDVYNALMGTASSLSGFIQPNKNSKSKNT